MKILYILLLLFFSFILLGCHNKLDNSKASYDSVNTDTTATAIAIEEVLSPVDEVKTVAEQIKIALENEDIPRYESLIAELKEYGESLSSEEIVEFQNALVSLNGDYGKEMEKLMHEYQDKAKKLLDNEKKRISIESIDENEASSILMQDETGNNEENSDNTID